MNVAEQLWATDNHDARILATMIADPEKMTAAKLDAWARDLENYPVKDAFRKLASQAPLAKKRMEKWITAGGEWVCSAGWTVLCHLAMSSEDHPDTELETYLKSIETTIHGSKNRVKHAMNNTLIAIGIRNPHLEKKAAAAAKRIGKVGVDHGETNCKSPDAAAYVQRTVARKSKRRVGCG